MLPIENICIDECFVSRKERYSWKQYIPSKMSHFGMKCFVLHKRGSGCIWNFCIYTVKDTDYGQSYTQYRTSNHIVGELSHGVLYYGYKFCVYNWYTKIKVTKKLSTCMTYIAGKIRQQASVLSDIRTTLL